MGNRKEIRDMGDMTPEHREVMDNLVALTRMQLKNSLCFSMREAKYSWDEDRGSKMDLYLKTGVEEYWIIDPGTLVIERYFLDDDGTKFLLHDMIDRNTDEKNALQLVN